MRDTFTRENQRDFTNRYMNSYGYLVTESGVKTPVYFDTVDNNILYFTGLNGIPFNVRADTGTEFEFMQMTRRIYTGLNGRLYYLQRKPARQWQRGVSGSNTSAWCLTKQGPSSVRINHELMSNILLGEGTPLEGSIRLSDQFAIVDGLAYLYNHVIGTYADKQIALGSAFSLFNTELNDVCKSHGIGVKNA